MERNHSPDNITSTNRVHHYPHKELTDEERKEYEHWVEEGKAESERYWRIVQPQLNAQEGQQLRYVKIDNLIECHIYEQSRKRKKKSEQLLFDRHTGMIDIQVSDPKFEL